MAWLVSEYEPVITAWLAMMPAMVARSSSGTRTIAGASS